MIVYYILCPSFFMVKNTVFENPQKVSFNIASEASYVYISRQKLKKKIQFGDWRVFEKLKLAAKQFNQRDQF